jgi:hypothetical protein
LGQAARTGIGFGMILTAFSAPAWAFPHTPAIDPGSMVRALTLLAGGVLMLTEHRRRR